MKKILIFGTFDILHPGHVFFINKARNYGNEIIASVARDNFVKKIKKKLPINSEESRLKLLLDKKLVDYAYLSDEKTGTYSIIKKTRPDIICIGYDQTGLYNNLLLWLKKNNLNIKVIIVESFSPEKYKSSKLDEHKVYNTELNNINDMVFMAVDIETTGLNPVKDRIVEIGAVLFNKEGILDTFQRFVNPEMIIPDVVINIHGITNEMVKDAGKIENVLHQLQAFAHGACPVAHNAYFDIGFMLYDLALNNISFKNRIIFDTLIISRKVFKNLSSYSLKNLSQHFNFKSKNLHRALSDSIMCMKIFLKCIQRIESKRNVNVRVNVIEELKKSNKSGRGDVLTLNWKNILKNQKLDEIVNAFENKKEIKIKYPLTGNTYNSYQIKPYSLSIKKQRHILLTNDKNEDFIINKIQMSKEQ